MKKQGKPGNWMIYSNHNRGWFAWDCVRNKRLELVSIGSFSEAVDRFDALIGPYYASRSEQAWQA